MGAVEFLSLVLLAAEAADRQAGWCWSELGRPTGSRRVKKGSGENTTQSSAGLWFTEQRDATEQLLMQEPVLYMKARAGWLTAVW